MVEGDPSKMSFRVSGSSSGIVECAGAHPLQAEALHINIRVRNFRIVTKATGLRQQHAEFMNHCLPVPGEIGGTFTRTCGGIGISRHCSHRLKSEEHTSELQTLMRIPYAVF